ncbi:TonB-dependent receptor [Leptospira interrogans]|uniref:TonB-dependent receptor n=1 Tax=Leptospira interrogans serovar Pomona TaxID=44276 RepID=A0AA40WCJ8_LEPIR|nr:MULTISPECIES: TonB-dependent receptor [Leptospira]KYZ60903.1 TonB-dependent receptor [Leptospira interrogans serovar Pomona]MBE8344335.1 TonB-dependent receptor [Leptospira interrogans serovar Pomona]MBE8354213.1 TonB-dependent receptor [Leptospira interrogans serovar Pomona]MBE8357843.1 TonB-dependent receptor [Leptospira interrogans serovar Pomona]MBE8386908.1 TonB-dependent receptor [Leptospira interrogans serovar Pomona]
MKLIYKILILFLKDFCFRFLVFDFLSKKIYLVLFWVRSFETLLELISEFQKCKKTNLNIIKSSRFWNGFLKTKSFQKVFLFQKMRILGSLVVFVNKSLFRNLRTYFRNLWCGNSYRNLATEKSFKFGDSALRDIIYRNYCILLKIFRGFVDDFFGVLKITPKWILKIISIFFISNVIMAQEPNTEKEEIKKKEIVVTGKADFTNLNSASEDTVRSEQIRSRPISRTGEIAEFVPGMIATQHSGSGKGNQYFLRGFNLDHGTDFASHVSGIPINNPSHGHGQGYTDLSFLIPELIEEIKFKKGVYSAEEGNFSSAGSMNVSYFRSLQKGIVSLEGGTLGYARALVAKSYTIGRGSLLYALETSHYDGPWTVKENYKKVNGVVSYSGGDEQNGYRILAMGYRGNWHTTHQIPKRAIGHELRRFDTVDPTDGGFTNRASISGEAQHTDKNTHAKILIYGLYNDLSLFSNTTYYLDDPIRGDQIEQTDRRTVSGLKSSYKIRSVWDEIKFENLFGFQMRRDFIRNALYHTEKRAELDIVRSNQIIETNISVYYESKIHWSSKIRTIIGLRGDQFHVDDRNSELNDRKRFSTANPKGGIVFGPWLNTEIYLNAGRGFHTNDARGLTNKENTFTPIVRSYGGEFGVRSMVFENWKTVLSLWQLDLDSELIFEGDSASIVASRSSTRRGVEWSNYFEPIKGLILDSEVSISRSRFRGDESTGNFIPGSIEHVYSGGIALKETNGFFGSIRGRYFGPRALIEDNSVRSPPTTLFNFQIGKKFNDVWSIVFEIMNIQNAKVSDIDYYYASRLKSESEGPDEGGYNDIHTRPASPRSIRFGVRALF